MWKSVAGHKVDVSNGDNDDDWETDADYVNQMSEEEQRYGSKREIGAIDMKKFREETIIGDAGNKQKELEEGPQSSYGYGGKFGVEKDRMDSSAVAHDYVGKVDKHASQKDYSSGFGGKFGVQKDRQDKSAAGWDHIEKVEKHQSQKDYAKGFGGKFGVEADRQDKSAAGWDHIEKVDKHESQKDYSKGFGGKFGIQEDRQDRSAAGWDHFEKVEKHESQTDYSKGFGGKFGVQSDRQDKSAGGWDHFEKVEKHESQKDYSQGFGGKFGVQTDRMDKSALKYEEQDSSPRHFIAAKPDIKASDKTSSLRARFENLASSKEEEDRKKVEEERAKWRMQEEKSLKEAKLKQEEDKEAEVSPQNSQVKRSSFIYQEEPPLESQTSQIIKNNSEAQDERERLEAEVRRQEELLLGETSKGDIREPAPETESVQESHGITAFALYDYQAADTDEISFDPDDTITNIEMIDEGWWRGFCNGQYGLFPANYVQLHSSLPNET